MKKNTQIVVVVGSLSVTAFAIFGYLQKTSDESLPTHQADVSVKPIDSQSGQPQPALSELGSSSQQTTLGEMGATAKNLRAFVEYAKQHPERGGIYFAENAIHYCKQAKVWIDGVQGGDVQKFYAERYPGRPINDALAASRKLAARCDGFTEADYASINTPGSGALGEGRAVDPLIAAEKKMISDGRKKIYTYEEALANAKLFEKYGASNSGAWPFQGSGKDGDRALYFEGQAWGGYTQDVMRFAQIAINQQNDQKLGETFSHLLGCAKFLRCDLNADPVDIALDTASESEKKNMDVAQVKTQVKDLMSRMSSAWAEGRYQAFGPGTQKKSS
jgi:hypothetical protein